MLSETVPILFVGKINISILIAFNMTMVRLEILQFGGLNCHKYFQSQSNSKVENARARRRLWPYELCGEFCTLTLIYEADLPRKWTHIVQTFPFLKGKCKITNHWIILLFVDNSSKVTAFLSSQSRLNEVADNISHKSEK